MADYDYSGATGADKAKRNMLQEEMALARTWQDAVTDYTAKLAAAQQNVKDSHDRLHSILGVDGINAASLPALVSGEWPNGVHLVDTDGKLVQSSTWTGHVRVNVAPA